MNQYFPCQEADHSQIIRLESEAFGVGDEACQHWLQRGDGKGWRGIKNSQGLMQGALVRIPMAQWFCGRAVPMTGVAGVAVATEARGQGVGKKLMTGFLQELYEENVPLSTLYASTTGFYRGLGYERAGGKYDLTVMLRDFSYGSRGGGAIREINNEKERLAVEELYESHVNWHGSLVRDPYMWDRVRQLMGKTAKQFGIYSDSQLVGYFNVLDQNDTFDDRNLKITDKLLTTPSAQKAYLAYLASQRAICQSATWSERLNSPILLAFPERWSYNLALFEHWLLRIVKLKEALEMRGYPHGVKGSLHFHIQDDLFPSNAGSWILEVDGGQASVRKGGQANLKLSIRTLAAMYTGFLSAPDLTLAGLIEGDTESLELARRLFHQQPHLTDGF